MQSVDEKVKSTATRLRRGSTLNLGFVRAAGLRGHLLEGRPLALVQGLPLGGQRRHRRLRLALGLGPLAVLLFQVHRQFSLSQRPPLVSKGETKKQSSLYYVRDEKVERRFCPFRSIVLLLPLPTNLLFLVVRVLLSE